MRTVSMPRAQRGVVLFIALIVLVAMSLAGVALVRSVDSNLMLAGNLAFKQGATLAADAAAERARVWVLANSGGDALYQDISGSGYYATWQDTFNPVTFDWDGSGVVTLPTDNAGNTASYVVHRMCDEPGNPSLKRCVKAGTAGKVASSFGAVSYGSYPLSLTGQTPIYRITIRVRGPKNTTSLVQVVIAP